MVSERTAARERIAEKNAAIAAQAAKAKRRRLQLQLGIAAAVVVVAVVVIVAVARWTGSSTGTGGTSAASVTKAITAVPAATRDSIGAGTGTTAPISITAPALTSGGKPEILYVGAEYCPFCAAERWSVVEALSRFGSFSGLQLTTSSSTDTYPNTPTLTFVKAKYTSDTVAFVSREISDRQQAPLQSLTSAQQALVNKYDAAPYVPSASAGSIPFIDIGGKYIISGAQYSPELLAGKSEAQVAAALSNPDSAIAKGAIGSANLLTAAICATTGQKPAAVCTASGVVTAAKQLG